MQKLLIVALLLIVFSCKDREIARKPKADFTFTETTNGTVVFSNTSLNTVSYDWNLGNGISLIDPSPKYQYKSNGDFTVTLTVKNGKGESDQTSKVVSVRSVP